MIALPVEVSKYLFSVNVDPKSDVALHRTLIFAISALYLFVYAVLDIFL